MTLPATRSRQTIGGLALGEARGNGMSIPRNIISISIAQSSQISIGLVFEAQTSDNEC